MNAIVDRTLASSLTAGSISSLNYANKLTGLILGVFISAITTVISPILAKESSEKNIDGLKQIMRHGINFILLITIPAATGLIVLAKPIVQIAFERGQFDVTATLMTSEALIFYSIGLVSMALRPLGDRIYYSLQDTKTPMINGALSVGLNVVLNLILVQKMAHSGLALGTSIASTLATSLIFYGLRRKIGHFGAKSFVQLGLKSTVASTVMGITVHLFFHSVSGYLGNGDIANLISLMLAIAVGVIVYCVFCCVMGIKEVRILMERTRVYGRRIFGKTE